jgi:hypothetical protein
MDYGKIKNVISKNKVFTFRIQISIEGPAGERMLLYKYQKVVTRVFLREDHGEAVSFDSDKAQLNGYRELP